jgi:hypothetical protein
MSNKLYWFIYLIFLTRMSIAQDYNQANYSTTLYAKGKGDIRIFTNLYQEKICNPTDSRYYHFLSIIPEGIFAFHHKYNLGIRAKLRSVTLASKFNFFSTFAFKENSQPFYSNYDVSSISPFIRHGFDLFGKTATAQHSISIPILTRKSDGFIDWDGVSLQSQLFLNFTKKSINYFVDFGYLIENIDGTLFSDEDLFIPISFPISFLPGYFLQRQHYVYLLSQFTPKWDFTRNLIIPQGTTISFDFNPYGQIGLGYKFFTNHGLEIEMISTYFSNFQKNHTAFTWNLGLRKYIL